MTLNGLKTHRYFRPAIGAVLAVLCGLLLYQMPATQSWADASYDYLFRFQSGKATNKVVVVQMDETSAKVLATERSPWSRSLHTDLLNRLTEAQAALVVFDVRFQKERNREEDEAFAAAMRRNGHVVLAGDYVEIEIDGAKIGEAIPPHPRFLAAATNWGLTKTTPKVDPIRMFVPPAADEHNPDLVIVAAKLMGANLDRISDQMWIRYYGEDGGLDRLSYRVALERTNYFRNRVVFIGAKPRNGDPDDLEEDKFKPPSIRWEKDGAVGGVEILATQFLNLVNNDWLRRAAPNEERLILGLIGAALGFFLVGFRRGVLLGIAGAAALVLALGGVYLSYFTNYWFPWLIIVGGQVPCALAWAFFSPAPIIGKLPVPAKVEERTPNKTIRLSFPEEALPDAPEYEVITPEIGKGGFGKVWIARNAIGQWQALKAVYESSFNGNRGPYEAEFKGLRRYKPVSEKHPGLLRIDLVSKMKEEGYFYYVMELGDAQTPGWETQPKLYKPKDLENLRKQAPERRLPPPECVRIVTVLADALNFLHQQGLTHRDIKPSNVIFVNGRPKLADIGLVADIRPVDQVHTLVGTLGYMPPPPEKPGTPQADIYALGMLLYVISTGRDPGFFPDLATTLMERSGHVEFVKLNAIILKASQPDLAQRYQTTAEMLAALQLINSDQG